MGNFVAILFAYGVDLAEDDDLTYLNLAYKNAPVSKLDDVLDKLFARLQLQMLKTCRLVNQNWCSIASDAIRRRPTKLTFLQDNTLRIFRTPVGAGVSKIPLRELNNLLESNRNFSLFCSTFEFQGNMKFSDVRQFFKLYGARIEILIIKNLTHDFTRWPVIHDILLDAPNIKELTIFGSNYDFDASSTHDNVDMMIVPLPHLKIFRMDYETNLSTLYKILAGGSNLTRIENFDWPHVEIFLKYSSFLLTELKFVHSAGNQWEENHCRVIREGYISLTLDMANPKQFHPEDRWCNEAISGDVVQILEISKNCLETFHMLPLGWLQLEYRKFPKMAALKYLHISTKGAQSSLIFPKCIVEDTQKTFPALVNVSLAFEDYSEDAWLEYFPRETQFETVKSLEVLLADQSVSVMEFSLQEIRKMFPNLKTLKIKGQLACELMAVVFKIWDGIQLEEMDFELIEVRESFEVDGVLTGMDRNDCRYLAENLKKVSNPSKREVESVLKYLGNDQPCVRNFKDLRNFKIGFKDIEAQVGPSISNVSHVYGFNLMPNLNVTTSSV